jgi:hypothetical protein
VFDWAARRAVPIAVTMAGGYGHVIEETCAVHAQTIGLAYARYRSDASRSLCSAEFDDLP